MKRSSNKDSSDNLFKLYHYRKPTVRPEPPRFGNAFSTIESLSKKCEKNCTKNVVWLLLRSFSRGIFTNDDVSENLTQIIPPWTAFNASFDNNRSTFINVQYTPAFNAKPSDHKTVYTTLKKGQELMEACGQTNHIHTSDQQLLAIAEQIKFHIPNEFPTLVLRLERFHNLKVFISCIKKLWGDCG